MCVQPTKLLQLLPNFMSVGFLINFQAFNVMFLLFVYVKYGKTGCFFIFSESVSITIRYFHLLRNIVGLFESLIICLWTMDTPLFITFIVIFVISNAASKNLPSSVTKWLSNSMSHILCYDVHSPLCFSLCDNM